MHLYLGNTENFKGNSFKKLPPPIYKLSNLQSLIHRGLGLQEEPSAIFEAFPKPSKIVGDFYNLDRNLTEAQPVLSTLFHILQWNNEWAHNSIVGLGVSTLTGMSIGHLIFKPDIRVTIAASAVVFFQSLYSMYR